MSIAQPLVIAGQGNLWSHSGGQPGLKPTEIDITTSAQGCGPTGAGTDHTAGIGKSR